MKTVRCVARRHDPNDTRLLGAIEEPRGGYDLFVVIPRVTRLEWRLMSLGA
jgi:hypothetical protein